MNKEVEKQLEDEKTEVRYETYCTGCDWHGEEYTPDKDELLENHDHKPARHRSEHGDVFKDHVVDVQPLYKLDPIEQLYTGSAYVADNEQVDTTSKDHGYIYDVQSVSRDEDTIQILTNTPVSEDSYVLVRNDGKEYLGRVDEQEINGLVAQAGELFSPLLHTRVNIQSAIVGIALLGLLFEITAGEPTEEEINVEQSIREWVGSVYITVLAFICILPTLYLGLSYFIVGLTMVLLLDIARRFVRTKELEVRILDEREASFEDGLVVLENILEDVSMVGKTK
jgi:hypothetical protein